MKKIFLILVLAFMLTGCSRPDVPVQNETATETDTKTETDTATETNTETETDTATETNTETETEMDADIQAVVYPNADENTVQIVLDFPVKFESAKKEYRDILPERLVWGEYIPVVGYKDAESGDVYSILTTNSESVGDGIALYEKANGKYEIKPYDRSYLKDRISFPQNYTESLVFSKDLQRAVYSVKLPRRENGGAYQSLCNYGEIVQVVDDRYILVKFHRVKNFEDSITVNDTAVYLYDISTGEYTFLASEVENCLLSPDRKRLVYTSFVMDSGKRKDNCFVSVLDIENGYTTFFNVDSDRIFIVNWINKSEFYASIGEDEPMQKKAAVPISKDENTETSVPEAPKIPEADKKELHENGSETICISVSLPADAYNGEFKMPKGCDVSEFDFGGLSLFLKGYGCLGRSEYVVSFGAFINQTTKDLEEGRKIYDAVNDRFSLTEKLRTADGEVIAADPAMQDAVVDVSFDFGRVLTKGVTGLLNRDSSDFEAKYYSYKAYRWYNNGILEDSRISNRYNYAEHQLTEDEVTPDVIYLTDGEEVYRDSETVTFLCNNKVTVYSRETLKPIKTVDFSYTGSTDGLKYWELYFNYGSVAEVIDGRYVLVSYNREQYHGNDCSCGERIVTNRAVYRYDMLTDEYECLAPHCQTYEMSPDGRYFAYTYNTVEELRDGEGYYDLFDGGVFIKDLIKGKTLVFPYTVKGYSYYDMPTAVWQAVSWVNTDSLEEVLLLPEKDVPVRELVTVPEPDGKTVRRTLELPSSVSFKNLTVEAASEDIVLGDYLPMVKYPIRRYGEYSFLDGFSILYDGITYADKGEELYGRLNEAYNGEDTAELVFDEIPATRVIYLSSDLETSASLTLEDKGDGGFGSEYKLVQDGSTVYSETKMALPSEKLSLCEYYLHHDSAEFTYRSDNNDYRLERDGILLHEVYRNECFRVFKTTEEDSTLFYVYSTEENRITHLLTVPDRWAVLEQIIDGRYFLFELSSDKVYLYDSLEDITKTIGTGGSNHLLSPDLKYLICNGSFSVTSDGTVKYSFYITGLDSGWVMRCSTSTIMLGEGVYGYDAKIGMTVETVNWLSREKVMNAIS